MKSPLSTVPRWIRTAIFGGLVVIAVILGSMVAIVTSPSEHKTATVAAQPQPVKKPAATVQPTQKSEAPTTAPATLPAWQAQPASPDYPKGLREEESYTPASKTEPARIGRGSEEVFRTFYPKGWQKMINPSGSQNGEDGELNLVASNGALLGFTSLKAPVASNYGNDPLGKWKSQACAGNGGSSKAEKSVTVKFVTNAGLEATYVSYPCEGGVDNYAWYSAKSKLLVTLTDGPDGGDSSQIVGVVQLMIDRGILSE